MNTNPVPTLTLTLTFQGCANNYEFARVEPH